MQDFRISPGPQVWKQVEAALPEVKRKRRLAFWWWLPLGLLIGGGIWYAVGVNKTATMAENQQPVQASKQIDRFKEAKENVITATPATATEQENRAVNKVDAKNNSVSQTTDEARLNNNEVVKTSSDAAAKSKTVPEITNKVSFKSVEVRETKSKVVMRNKTVSKTTNQVAARVDEVSNTKEKVVQVNKTATGTTNEIAARSNKVSPTNITDGMVNNELKDEVPQVLQSATVKHKNIANKNTLGITDSSMNAFTETTAANPADTADTVSSAAEKAPQSSTQNKKTKQVNWLFFASAGISNTSSSLLGSMHKSLEFANPQNFVTANPGNINSTPQKSTPGFSYAAGIERLQKIGQHWQWYTGAQYGYLSNHQKTGARKDSALTIFDNTAFNNSNSRSGTTVPGFYYPGSSISHTNTIHQLGLQTGLIYTLNPAAKKPFSIRGGLATNWQVATTQLLYDATKGAYYYSSDATNHVTIGTQLGFDWKLAKRFTIGAFFQYNFTRINKLEIGTGLHWKMSGIRIAIPLRKLPPKPSEGGLKK